MENLSPGAIAYWVAQLPDTARAISAIIRIRTSGMDGVEERLMTLYRERKFDALQSELEAFGPVPRIISSLLESRDHKVYARFADHLLESAIRVSHVATPFLLEKSGKPSPRCLQEAIERERPSSDIACLLTKDVAYPQKEVAPVATLELFEFLLEKGAHERNLLYLLTDRKFTPTAGHLATALEKYPSLLLAHGLLLAKCPLPKKLPQESPLARIVELCRAFNGSANPIEAIFVRARKGESTDSPLLDVPSDDPLIGALQALAPKVDWEIGDEAKGVQEERKEKAPLCPTALSDGCPPEVIECNEGEYDRQKWVLEYIKKKHPDVSPSVLRFICRWSRWRPEFWSHFEKGWCPLLIEKGAAPWSLASLFRHNCYRPTEEETESLQARGYPHWLTEEGALEEKSPPFPETAQEAVVHLRFYVPEKGLTPFFARQLLPLAIEDRLSPDVIDYLYSETKHPFPADLLEKAFALGYDRAYLKRFKEKEAPPSSGAGGPMTSTKF